MHESKTKVRYSETLINEVYQIGKEMYEKYQSWKDGPNETYWKNTYDMATWYFDTQLRYHGTIGDLMDLYYSPGNEKERALYKFWEKILVKEESMAYTAGHVYTAEDIAYYLAFRHINSERWP